MASAAQRRTRKAVKAARPPVDTRALKKAGAWRDRPLPPNTPAHPCYVQLPARLCVIDASPAQLRACAATLSIAPTAAGPQVTIPALRSSAHPSRTDITRAVLDRTLAVLHTPTTLAERTEHFVMPPRPGGSVSAALAARVDGGNDRIAGRGTAADPFTCRNSSPIYVSTPVTIVFPGVRVEDINLDTVLCSGRLA